MSQLRSSSNSSKSSFEKYFSLLKNRSISNSLWLKPYFLFTKYRTTLQYLR